jgi:membrane-bound serine protease (ClpP class)
VVAALVGTIILLFALGRNLLDNPLAQVLIFKDATRKEEGYTTDSFVGSELEGKQGKAVTDMHPTGTVEIDGERYDGYSRGEWIEAGETIRVVQAKGFALLVEKVG